MGKIVKFEQIRFVTSALKPEEYPSIKTSRSGQLPEIAIVGKSNVGKSSLINSLFRGKSIAKASSTPGKTQRINFFCVDDLLLLVDLPGYGYAKASKNLVQEWGQGIDYYLNHRPSLKLLLILIDLRRTPDEDDLKIANWAMNRQIPILIIFTKQDKLTQTEIQHHLETNLAFFPPNTLYLAYSSKQAFGREKLIQIINKGLIWD